MELDRKTLGRSKLKLSVLGFGGTGLGNLYVAMSERSVIDAHHHLWKLSRADYGWIGYGRNPAVASIERDYLVEDYRVLALLLRHPDLRAIVNHGAKPDIAGGKWQPWADDMRRIGRETQAYCKLSGLVTEARPGWKPDELRRYAEYLFEWRS